MHEGIAFPLQYMVSFIVHDLGADAVCRSAAAGLDKDDTYVCCVVPCRSPVTLVSVFSTASVAQSSNTAFDRRQCIIFVYSNW